MVDLAVIGAGPAGVAAAVAASRAGLDVELFDRARFPRDKICGDGLTTSALRQLEWLGVDPRGLGARDVREVVVAGPRGHRVRFELPSGPGRYAAVLPRLTLDAALVDAAASEGVKVSDGCAVTGVTQRSDVVVVSHDQGTTAARHIVAADGMWSPTRKWLGLNPPDYRGEWHAIRQYVDGVTGPADSQLFVSFEADILPGYFWCFPLGDGRANIGFGIARGGRHTTADMRWLWPDLLARPAIAEWLGPEVSPAGPHRAWPIPARIDTMTAAHGSVLFVGDAVAAGDVMTGEGIGQALETGRAAGVAIAANLGHPAQAAAAYRSDIANGLLADHRMASWLSSALSHRKGVRAALRIADSTGWSSDHFVRWLFEDSPRGLALTPQRWHRGVLSGAGAWPEG